MTAEPVASPQATEPADAFGPDVAAAWLAGTGLLRDAVRQAVVARQLASHLGPQPDATAPRDVLDVLDVLDVGCGQGTQALQLARVGHRVTGVEPDAGLRAACTAAVAALPADAAARVEVLPGRLDDLDAALGGRTYDVVLCHGVLMYLPDPAPAVRSLAARVRRGGLLSLLARNADALALRPARRRDWAEVQAALDSAEGPRTYVNGLGVTARADRVEDLRAVLRRTGLRIEAWYGVRVLTDDVAPGTPAPADPAELEAVVAAELRAGRTDPYRRVAALVHVLGRRWSGPPGLSTDHTGYDSEVVRGLEARVQQEYVVRYGGPDGTPVDSRQFDPPGGAFLVVCIDGEPIACGGFRRHDDRSAELKRMYVVPEHRGRGHGRVLLAELERRARAVGYERLLLETGLAQPEAIALYTTSGYAPVPSFGHYRDSPGNRCFAKAL